jgi:hypothetical protein
MPEHKHGDDFHAEPEDFADRPVNTVLLGNLTGASLDGCQPCQKEMLAVLAEDPATTARLVSVACISIMGLFGGLPASLVDPKAPGLASPEFRKIAAAGVDIQDTGLAVQRMWNTAAAMTHEQRWSAGDSALDLMAGML